MNLTLELFHDQRWQPAATLDIPDPARGRLGRARLGYANDHALAWMQRDDEHACSLNLPVELMFTHEAPAWFGFLDDIMPAGAGRRYWVDQLGLGHLPAAAQDYALLQRGTIAPVGNMRIREALPTLPGGSRLQQLRFTLTDVTERHTDFLEYAQQMGAVSGGATGAGGEAPKLLLRCSPRDEIWIDTFQDAHDDPDAYYLVKFPRNRREAIDCDILRSEYHYYHELEALGVATIATSGMRLTEGERYPSLWLPRFDVVRRDGRLLRHGLESVYSILNAQPGAFLNHAEVLRTLVARLRGQYRVSELGESFDAQAFVIEWVKRDFLNVAFGNSDNHGRNAALIKRPDGMWLAPVYDFAPMKADPEGVIRSTRWPSPFEEGGRFDWHGIAAALADLAPPERMLAELEALAARLLGLRERLAARGVPAALLDKPALNLGALDRTLKQQWGLA